MSSAPASPTPRTRPKRKHLRHHDYFEWGADLDSVDPEERTPVERRVKFDDGSWATYHVDPDNPLGWDEGRGWRYGWKPGGVKGPPLLYRGPQTRAAMARGEVIYVFEGEKDCDRAAELGLAATTNAGGTGNTKAWKGQFGLARRLKGAHVRIVRDRDEPGLKHAREVWKCLDGVANAVEHFEPPERYKDFADMIDGGLAVSDLVPIVLEWTDPQPPTQYLHEWALRTFRERGREVTCRDLTHQLRDGQFTEDEAREAVRRFQAAVEQYGTHPFTLDEAMTTFDKNFFTEAREPWITSEIAEEAHRQRIRRDARRVLDEEEATAALILPPTTGNLATELALAKTPPAFTVAELHPSGGNTNVTAMFKTGKTTLLQHLTGSIVDGVPFLGRFAVAPLVGNVGFWNYEVSPWQFEAWFGPMGIKNADRIWPLHLRGSSVPLMTKAGADYAVRWLEEHAITVWIIDTFAKAYNGDENSNSEVGRFLDALDVIKNRAGVSDLFMSMHTGRGEMAEGAERARGATRLDDWADSRWTYTRTGRIDGPRFLAAEGRDVSVGEFEVTFDPTTKRLSAGTGTRRQHRERESTWKVLTVVAGTAGLSKTDVQTKLGAKGGHQARWVNDAIELGYVEVKENGKRHELFVTEVGERFLRTGRQPEPG